MRAAGIKALGEPVEIFEVDELAMPAAREVLIDVVAAGIGNWDDLVRIGSWQIGGPAPIGPGTEGHHVEGGGCGRPPRHDHGRPAAGGTERRRIRRLRPPRWSAAFGPRGAAGPRHPSRADRVRPSARSGGTSAARGSRGSGRRDRPVAPNLAWPPTLRESPDYGQFGWTSQQKSRWRCGDTPRFRR